ncbi:hypothetical protein [Paractinoplanes durhamensis]|uniref:hypothetical protein n=1 Tax=Paractinoplanes durhamensis TaxID=113563 RepID=UPI0036412184
MTLLRATRPEAGAPAPPELPRRRTWRSALRRDWQLYSLAVLPLMFFLVFRYLPMLGNVIAFRRYSPAVTCSASTGSGCATSRCS